LPPAPLIEETCAIETGSCNDLRMTQTTPMITVFTATFNRVHTLHRVFESLEAQTLQDFEWLIVDDGSSDRTEQTVASWKKSASFQIRYFWQANAGKHVAYNRALQEARGKFFAILDSDDGIVGNALERLLVHWNSIPANEQPQFYAVAGLSRDPKGEIVGDKFPTSPFDSNQRELRYVHRIHGEKFRLLLTDILRRFPFPELPSTQFIPEGTVWLEIGKTYRQRGVNEIFRIYYSDPADVSLSSRKNLPTTARGRLHYYIWLFNNDFDYFFRSPTPFLKAALMLPIASIYVQTSWRQSLRAVQRRSAKCLLVCMLPASVLLYGWYRTTGRWSRPE
jgi:glycosyltransferase involved in cell wall biosynthesis